MSGSDLEDFLGGLDAVAWEAAGAPWAFTFVSENAERLLGYPRSRWVSEPGFLRGLVHPEDREDALAGVARAIANCGGYQLEYRATAADGGERWLREIGRADIGPDGQPRLRGLLVDVSVGVCHGDDSEEVADGGRHRSRAWLERAWVRERELTRHLRALNDVKDSFLTAVSHEMRTPLSTIMGIALTLERSGARLPQDVAGDLISRLAGNARKLDQLLTDLLDLDRLQRGLLMADRAPTDVPALVRRVVEESGLAGDRAVEVDAEPVVVAVDPAKTERILENLFTNTARHTPAGTPVWVRVQREGGGVLLAVEDAGPGVPAELRETIFEPFRQADGSSSVGVGVGLSLVARFAELHGGRAWVEDRQGGGASFRVFLPDEPAHVAPHGAPQGAPQG